LAKAKPDTNALYRLPNPPSQNTSIVDFVLGIFTFDRTW
jgi:hypothetical protein